MEVTCPHCFNTHEVDLILRNKLRTFDRYLSVPAKAVYGRKLSVTLLDGKIHIDVCPVCDEVLESGIKDVCLLNDKLDPKEKMRLHKEWNKEQVRPAGGHDMDAKFEVATGSLVEIDRNSSGVAPEKKAEYVQTQAEPHDHALSLRGKVDSLGGDAAIRKVHAVSFAPVFERVLTDSAMATMDGTDTGLPETYVKAAACAFNRLVEKGMLKYGMLFHAQAIPLATFDTRFRQVVTFVGFSHFSLDALNQELGGRYFIHEGGIGTNDWRPILSAIGEKPLYRHSVEEVQEIVQHNAEEVGRGAPSEPVRGRDI